VSTPACFGTRVPSSRSFSVTKFCSSNKYLIHNLPTLLSWKLIVLKCETSNSTFTLLQHQYHTTINLLCYTYIAVILRGLCIPTSVAIYGAKRSHPAEVYGVTCQGIYPNRLQQICISICSVLSYLKFKKYVCHNFSLNPKFHFQNNLALQL